MATRKTSRPRNRSKLSQTESRFLNEVGSAIRALASKQNISLEQLAYQSGVSKGFLYDLANGKGNPSLLLLYRIAIANNIPLSRLIPQQK